MVLQDYDKYLGYYSFAQVINGSPVRTNCVFSARPLAAFYGHSARQATVCLHCDHVKVVEFVAV